MTATRDIVEELREECDCRAHITVLLREAADEITSLRARTGYTTIDTSEGEQAKPCYPDPVMDAVRRCAEIAEANGAFFAAFYIRSEFGLLPTSET